MQLTPNFSIEDFTHSDTAFIKGIDNQMPVVMIQNAKFTCLGMERIRACLLGLPIEVLSGYRSAELNAAVGGQLNSQHMIAEAMDFICPRFGKPVEIARRLSANIRVIGIDQLILEKTWVHASFRWQPRYEVLTIRQGITIKGLVG